MPVILALARQTKNPVTGRFEFRPLTLSPQAFKRLKGRTVVRRRKQKASNLEEPFVRAMEARKLIGGRSLLERAERAGWIKPVRRGKRMTLFKRQDVEACVARIGWGELP
jgi:hypothetical protein